MRFMLIWSFEIRFCSIKPMDVFVADLRVKYLVKARNITCQQPCLFGAWHLYEHSRHFTPQNAQTCDLLRITITKWPKIFTVIDTQIPQFPSVLFQKVPLLERVRGEDMATNMTHKRKGLMMFAKWHFELERDLQTKDAWKKRSTFYANTRSPLNLSRPCIHKIPLWEPFVIVSFFKNGPLQFPKGSFEIL